MGVISRFVIALHALGLVGCTRAEVTDRDVEPTPVVAREGFRLPATVGPERLPSAFIGVVVTPNQLEGFAGPGLPLTMILDEPAGLAEPTRQRVLLRLPL